VEPVRRIIFIRKAGMRACRVQPPEEGFYESVALAIPFVQIRQEERRIPV
jgi:hypothetical protein